MDWRFTLIDRYNNRTVIDEPVGWDTFSIRIKRNPVQHGIVREISGNSLEFHGTACTLLKREYEQYGIRGKYDILIEWKCGTRWKEFYPGIISFDMYNYTCGQLCFVTADIEQTGALVSFINRFDQKVEVGNAVAFDQTTPLTVYEKLTRRITLPSKTIVLRGISTNTDLQNYNLSGDAGWNFGPSNTGPIEGSISIPFALTDVNTMKDYTPASLTDFLRLITAGNEYTPEMIYNNPDQELNCTGSVYNLDFRVKGNYKNNVFGSGNNNLTLVLKRGMTNFNSGATTIASWAIRFSNNAVFDQAFDKSFIGTVNLLPGEKLWLDLYIQYVKNTNYADDVEISFDPETRFKATVESKCDPTDATLYIINETASRVTEAITDNQLKVYSEYLGRKDSEPYSFPSNGCGSLRAVALGLDIRNAKLQDGSNPKLFLSMQDIFDHLSATDNIGIGSEGDNKMRIESWKWFYKDTLRHRCLDVDTIKKSIRADQHFTIFKTGYDKWETEDFNGLDEILTKREYRTQITQTKNTFEKLSKIMASGYAIETTRRKQGTDKDWRYDNDVFAIVLTRTVHIGTAQFITFSGMIQIPFSYFYQVGFFASTITITGSVSNNGTFTIVGVSTFMSDILIQVAEPLVDEVAANVTIEDTDKLAVELDIIKDGANLVDPATVYNYRISPARMAMKWFSRIASLYRHISAGDKLIFSSGDGNYVAEGQLKYQRCKLEAGVLKENDDISTTKFADADDAAPIEFADMIEYKYPLGAGEFKNILDNPYDLIEYRNPCEHGQGWIDEIEYWPEQGLAKFILTPKVSALITGGSGGQEGILMESGEFITAEDGVNLTTE